MIYNDSLLYKIAFGSVKGMTYRLATDLIGRIGSEEVFFSASTESLKSLLGFDNKILDRSYRDEVLEAAKRELDFVEANKVDILYFDNQEQYPQRLRECDDAPPLLYALGKCNMNRTHVISVVGTRHATLYGIGFIKELIEDIGKRLPDTIIVSGLAYGIDVNAHKESLKNNVPTAAVLAHGLSTIYPSANRGVAAEMVKKGGLLLTDYPHDARIHRPNFLARNRIVAGLSDCTVVVESAEKGGAIVTAEIASNYNRDVFALPGRANDTYSRGCNRLISQNRASLIQDPEDLFNLMGWKYLEIEEEQKLFYQPTEEEQKILDFLEKRGEGQLNRISVETGLPIHKLMGVLVDMEFKHLIVNHPGGIYRKS